VPALEPYIIEPIWQQFKALLPERRTDHPLGCHRSRVPERIVFEKLVQVLVFGCAYWRIADASCSESTLRRRRDEWIELGLMERLRLICLEAYDRIIGLELSEVAVDCCITKAPCGGEKAGPSPVDRSKRGIKRSMAVDASGIPLGAVMAPANRHDSPLLVPTIEATSEALGTLPEGASVHLEIAATTRSSPASAFGSWGWDGRSRGRVSQLPIGPRIDGWSSGRARGTTPTRSWCGARSGWEG
jgi:transposase